MPIENDIQQRDDPDSGLLTFERAIHQFRASLEQLRDFVTLLDPVIQAEASKAANDRAEALRPVVEAFQMVSKQLKGSSEPHAPDDRPAPEVDLDGLATMLAGHPFLRWQRSGPHEMTIAVSGPLAKVVEKTAQAFARRREHRIHLYRSSLVSLASAAEIYFGSLLGVFYRLKPDAAELNERTLTFKDLVELGDVEEARKTLLDSKIEQIVRGSVTDWLEYARQRLGLSMGYLDRFRDQLVEIFQRRNLIVHAGSRVNALYLAKTKDTARGGLKLGDRVTVDDGYLLPAIDQVELSFLLVGLELWKKLEPKSSARIAVITHAVIEYLDANRFELAEGLSFFGIGDKQADERSRLVCQVNYWQALKWAGRFDEIEQEVRNADFSAKSRDFDLAKLTLLGDADGFFGLASSLLRSDQISVDALTTWPLFREMRKDARFAALAGYSTGAQSAVASVHVSAGDAVAPDASAPGDAGHQQTP